MDLKQVFIQLVQRYSKDQILINSYWEEIEKKYTGKKRHYHTLTHLTALANQLNDCKHLTGDWDTLLFSVFYHDIIYNVLKNDNEEKSAELAVHRLSLINFPKVNSCKEQILATKSHHFANNNDINLFTDADLSILGQPPSDYTQYCLQIRKEYSVYPDLIYKPGRRKVVNHFLAMPRIFKTDHFFGRYEHQARLNLKTELEDL